MNNLSNSIYDYYVEMFTSLPFDKRLHFASRLYLWSDDAFGKRQLDSLRQQITCHEDVGAALRNVYDHAQATIHHGSKNAAALRAPYFEKYPQLRAVAMVLFRLTFLKTIYGLDSKNAFYDLFDKAELETMFQELLADDRALAILSTHAVNVLYLYNRVVLEDDIALDPARFLQLGARTYDLNDPIELQLFIYLYTHCIIGESRFYSRPLPARYLPTYKQMFTELEQTIETRYDDIKLDNKFEFLVCGKLLDMPTKLERRIDEEAAMSVSPKGTFLVDRHNNNPQAANGTLDTSEHRNVLFLMSHRPFQG